MGGRAVNTYHKIHSVFKREPDGKRRLIEGRYSLPEFEYLKDNEWVFTEKVDGTNTRILWDGRHLVWRGKTDKAQPMPHLVDAFLELFRPRFNAFKAVFGQHQTQEPDQPLQVCLYGEGYGPKINKGGKYRPDHGFVLFDIKIGGWWLTREKVEETADQLNLDIVPILGRGTLPQLVDVAKQGFRSTWGDFEAEGIIARPATDLRTRSGQRIITKVKCKDFR